MTYEAWFWFTAGIFTMGVVSLFVVMIVLPEILRRRRRRVDQ